MEADYYALLGVERDADLETIKAAYRKRAGEYHPDHGGSNREMKLLNTAWEVLSDPKLRKLYDDTYAAELERLIRDGEPKASKRHSSAATDSAVGFVIKYMAGSLALFLLACAGGVVGTEGAAQIMGRIGLWSDSWMVNFVVLISGWILGTAFVHAIIERIGDVEATRG